MSNVSRSRGGGRSKVVRQTELGERLRTLGFRLTAQRLAIAEVLAGSKDHPSAQEIYERVREQLPHITRGTIYNTLNTLVQRGFVQALAFPGGVRYDTNLTSHVNLVCIECGSILDALGYEDRIDRLRQELSTNIRFDIVSQRLDFYGRCARCRDTLRPRPRKQ